MSVSQVINIFVYRNRKKEISILKQIEKQLFPANKQYGYTFRSRARLELDLTIEIVNLITIIVAA